MGWKITNEPDYFKRGLTWTALTSGTNSFRYSDSGFIFDSNKGPMLFPKEKLQLYILALLNSHVTQYYLKAINPSMSLQNGDLEKIPVIIADQNIVEQIDTITDECVSSVREDWDSFETSWDFKTNPLVSMSKGLCDATATAAAMDYYYGCLPEASCPLEICYLLWQGQCKERFEKLKANEEELNRIFIDIYGLQDELTPEVEEKDVTVRKADLQRDIKSLLSYAVGCMFGRYSLDVDGLVLADQGATVDDYLAKMPNPDHVTFMPDGDNVLPITDDEYFDDDIVRYFIDFVRTVYGEETLEQNLAFIAEVLGGKGTSREVIRTYFLKDFFKDHCQTYKKRPIYWLFDSGKKNGFKCLVYMHRYQPDLLARIRTDYVHEQQERYRAQIGYANDALASAERGERVRLDKRVKKLNDQLKETIGYEEKLHHLADQMIKIDLDDGVKVNYAKFQDVLAKIK